jgi:hypothetical protein
MLLSAVSYPLSAIRCLLSAVCCLLSDAFNELIHTVCTTDRILPIQVAAYQAGTAAVNYTYWNA